MSFFLLVHWIPDYTKSYIISTEFTSSDTWSLEWDRWTYPVDNPFDRVEHHELPLRDLHIFQSIDLLYTTTHEVYTVIYNVMSLYHVMLPPRVLSSMNVQSDLSKFQCNVVSVYL